MEDRSPRTIFCRGGVTSIALVVIVLATLAVVPAGCAGRHAGARTLAAIGAIAVGAGSATWAAGERMDDQHGSAPPVLSRGGFITAAIGLAAVVAAGGWMAAAVACNADPDCPEDETCREVPAPPGGVPYKQCVPRQP
jgi:hypothetical protein